MRVEDLEGGVTNVVLRGRLDSAGAEAIEGSFNAVANAKRAIVVDLSQVNFLTSRGIVCWRSAPGRSRTTVARLCCRLRMSGFSLCCGARRSNNSSQWCLIALLLSPPCGRSNSRLDR
jgi:hypothetical protein